MDGRDNGLERLCKVNLDLTDGENEKVIRLAEGLLKSQKVITNEKINLTMKKDDSDLKIG
jgi:hypothetical protein